MSWQVPAFALLAIVLIGGAWWYERSRPPSQVVALVAALAALAVGGRLVLSPIPNVTPVTDLTLIAGYVLGPAPGFAVGALTALVSNLWLGQGPWTPWQMGAWGLCGVLGAGIAYLYRRRTINRVELAVVCGLAGLAYGAVLDLSLMVTYGGEQSLDRYLALSARGVPFNVAHMLGNVVFALVTGPALIRILRRYRHRFEFAWPGGSSRPAGAPPSHGAPPAHVAPPDPSSPGPPARAAAVILVLALAVSLGAALGGRGAPRAAAAPSAPTARASAGGDAGVSYLRRAQNPDGGFADTPGYDSSPEMTGWASLGLLAAGVNPHDVRANGRSAMDYLASTAGEITTTGDLERTILVIRGAGSDPRDFAGADLVARLVARRRPDGSWGGQVNLTAFGVLALEAAGGRGTARSATWLVDAQAPSGGWGLDPGAPPEADTTGGVLQALAAAGRGRGAIGSGLDFLRRIQKKGGGYELAGAQVNSQSTAWAVQGIVAGGASPRSFRRGGRTPLDYLAGMQSADGHYRYSRSYDQTPVWVTAQALDAVYGRAFPIAPVARLAGAPGGGGDAGGGAGGASGGGSPGSSGLGAVTGGGRTVGKGGKQGGKQAAAGAPTGASAADDEAADTGVAADEPLADYPLGAADGGEHDDGGFPLALGVGLGVAALIGALYGGWIVYRRRLP